MYVKVRVIAGAKKELFKKVSETSFKLSVHEEAKQNQANRRIIMLVAEHFGVSTKKIRIISGHHHPSKILDVGIV
jgi:uncharacterized protein YggU (UPF0235/DUF167 family)